MSPEPFASIVIATCGRRRPALVDALESLLSQDYPAERYEIVVVANGTAVPPVPQASPRVRLVSLPEANASRARNAGVSASRGDPVVFVDDDVVAPSGWLRALVMGSLRHPEAGCVGGPVRARFDARPPRTCGRHELAGTVLDEGVDERDVDEVWGANMAVTRKALELAGPLFERARAVEESEWQQRLLRAGGRVVYVPDAWLWHRRAGSDLRLPVLVRRAFQLGYTVVALGQEGPAAKFRRQLIDALRHAFRARCTRGLTDAARAVGSIWAIAVGRRRRPWATSLRTSRRR